MLFDFITF